MNNQKYRAVVLGMGQPAYYLKSEEFPASGDGENNQDENTVLKEIKISPIMKDTTIISTAIDKVLTTERFSRTSGRIPACAGDETLFLANSLENGIYDPKFKEFCFDIPDSKEDFDSLYPEIHPSKGCEYNRYLITEEQPDGAYESGRYGRISDVLYYGAEVYFFTDNQVKLFIQQCMEKNSCSLVGDAFLFIVLKKGKLFLVSAVIKSDGLHIDCNRYNNYLSVQVPRDYQRCYFVARTPSYGEMLMAHDM